MNNQPTNPTPTTLAEVASRVEELFIGLLEVRDWIDDQLVKEDSPAPVADEPAKVPSDPEWISGLGIAEDPAPVADPPTDNLATHPGDGTSCVNCSTPIVLRPEGGWTHTSRTWNGAVCPPRFTNATPAPVADPPTDATDAEKFARAQSLWASLHKDPLQGPKVRQSLIDELDAVLADQQENRT